MITQASIVRNGAVVDSDWHFNNLHCMHFFSHLQSQSESKGGAGGKKMIWETYFQELSPLFSLQQPWTTSTSCKCWHLCWNRKVYLLSTSIKYFELSHHLVSPVGRAPVCWVGGRMFKPWLGRKCCLCNVICKWLGYLFFLNKEKNRRSRLILLSVIWFLWDIQEPTPLLKNSRGHRPQWLGQPLLGWVGYL